MAHIAMSLFPGSIDDSYDLFEYLEQSRHDARHFRARVIELAD